MRLIRIFSPQMSCGEQGIGNPQDVRGFEVKQLRNVNTGKNVNES